MAVESQISIEGIYCYAFHGCMDEEGLIGGNYTVDVYIWSDILPAVASDALTQTVDYSLVYQIVSEQMAIRSRLIEHVCGRILEALRNRITPLDKLVVRVTKHHPPVSGPMEKASVTLTYKA